MLKTLPHCSIVHVKERTSSGEFDCISVIKTENQLKPKVIIAENKWKTGKSQISDINEFVGKAEKLLNSALDVECLIFTSYAGFTKDAEARALDISKIKNVALILLDGSDIEKCVKGDISFKDLLDRKITELTSKLIS